MKNLLKRIGYRFVLEDVMNLAASFVLLMMKNLHSRNTYRNYTAKQENLVKLRDVGNEKNKLF